MYGRGFAGRDGTDNMIGQTCVLCIEEFKVDDVVVVLRPCNHVYHCLCFERYVASRAPEELRRLESRYNPEPIKCPEDRSNALQTEAGCLLGVVGSTKLEQIPEHLRWQHAFRFDTHQDVWYRPSKKGRQQEGLQKVRTEEYKMREVVNRAALSVLKGATERYTQHGDSWYLNDYANYFIIIDEYLWRHFRTEAINPRTTTFRDFLKWVMTHLDFITIKDDPMDFEYGALVRTSSEYLGQPLREVLSIPQYNSDTPDTFKQYVLNTEAFRKFQLAVWVRALLSNVDAPVLRSLIRQLNNALLDGNLNKARVTIVEMSEYINKVFTVPHATT